MLETRYCTEVFTVIRDHNVRDERNLGSCLIQPPLWCKGLQRSVFSLCLQAREGGGRDPYNLTKQTISLLLSSNSSSCLSHIYIPTVSTIGPSPSASLSLLLHDALQIFEDRCNILYLPLIFSSAVLTYQVLLALPHAALFPHLLSGPLNPTPHQCPA